MNLKKTLKPFKKKQRQKELHSKNRAFNTIRTLYTHLSDLNNDEILDYYNVASIEALEEHIEYIKNILIKKIANYKEALEEISGCFCLDSNHDFKYLYETQKEAKAQLDYSFKTKRVKLKLYSCPYGCGWHLTRV